MSRRSTIGLLRTALAAVAVACSTTPQPADEPAASSGVASSANSGSVPARTARPRTYTATRFANEASAARPARRGPVTTGHTVFGPKNSLQYFGGRVISNVNVVAVDWTSAVDPAISSYLPGFFATITSSAYFSWLGEYDTVGLTGLGDGLPGSNQTIGYGGFDDTYVVTPLLATSTSLDDSDIQVELAAQLDAAALPAPLLDAAGNVNSLYVFDFPAAYTVTLGGLTSCKQFCGYHGTIAYGPSALSVPYAVLMDMGPSSPCHTGCGSSKSYVDNSMSVHSHELVEAITDAEAGLSTTASGRPIAWYDSVDSPGGESGDLCDGIEETVAGYTVQAIWSNVNGGCIAVPPLCDGSVPPPYCTPCAAADAGVACHGATPACETDPSNTRVGQCVACATSSDCGGVTPLCNKSSDSTDDTCRACTKADCAGSKPVCGTSGFDRGRCVECDVSDGSACAGATPYCDLLDFKCVGCIDRKDCSGGTPVCDGVSQTCRRCVDGAECDTNVCDATTGTCVQCVADSDCGLETCDASTHTCRCKNDAACSNPMPVCGSAKTCGPCRSDVDCAGNASGAFCASGSCVQCGKSSDCMPPTPYCNPATNSCEDAPDAGPARDAAAPGLDARGGEPDAKGSGGGTSPHAGASVGGCSIGPAGCERRGAVIAPLTLLALAALRRRRPVSAPAIARVRSARRPQRIRLASRRGLGRTGRTGGRDE